MTRYVIVGAGAVGATVAAELHRAGSAVVLVARGANLAALRAGGLRYLCPDGEHVLRVPVAAGPDEVDLRVDDVLVVAGKSQATEAIVASWAWRPVAGTAAGDRRPSAAEAIPVLLMQNGLENERVALRRFNTVYGAVVVLPASHLRPGEVVSPGDPLVGRLWLGRYPEGAPDALHAIAADLSAARFGVRVVDDLPAYKAAKLLNNVANAVDALYQPSPLRDRAQRALRDEARGVLERAGLPIGDLGGGLSNFTVGAVAGRTRPGSSTWQSLARGVGVEADFLNGEVVLLARLHHDTAPLNQAIQRRANLAAADGIVPGSLDDTELTRDLPGIADRAEAAGENGIADRAEAAGENGIADRARRTDRDGRAAHSHAATPPRPAGRAAVLVGTGQLRAELTGDEPPVLLDVRWALGDPHGLQHYLAGHLPSARFVDLDRELAGPATSHGGRHPLPPTAELQQSARAWGIHRGSRVVAYDNSGGVAAARAWWLLRWAGIADVRLLDGGLGAWSAAGHPLETGEPGPIPPGDVELTGGHLPTLDADAAADLARRGVLLDARAAERYRGEVEPIDPRAGHVPGAISAPTSENLTPSGTFRPAAELRARFRQLGLLPDRDSDGDSTATAAPPPVGVYCGSGVTAAHEVAALAIAGVDAALFPGSWSAWSADPRRPAATGPAPG